MGNVWSDAVRYEVGTSFRLAEIRLALDFANGLIDLSGDPIVVRPSVSWLGNNVNGDARLDPAEHGVFASTETMLPPVIDASGATYAVRIPTSPLVDAHLGSTVNGVNLPTAASLKSIDQLPPSASAEARRRLGL
jgi:hypothetical protein